MANFTEETDTDRMDDVSEGTAFACKKTKHNNRVSFAETPRENERFSSLNKSTSTIQIMEYSPEEKPLMVTSKINQLVTFKVESVQEAISSKKGLEKNRNQLIIKLRLNQEDIKNLHLINQRQSDQIESKKLQERELKKQMTAMKDEIDEIREKIKHTKDKLHEEIFEKEKDAYKARVKSLQVS